MPGAVFFKTLRDARNGILGWGIALALYALFIVTLYPTMTGIEAISDFLGDLPPILQAVIGEDIGDFATPEGFLSLYMVVYIPLILGAYGILAGAAAVMVRNGAARWTS
jgi:hypothetical protein